MPDVRLLEIDEMEATYDGIARRARAELGVTAWGMQVMTLPPNWDGYPDHMHDASTAEAGQEEVYIPLEGSAELVAGEERFELRPGVMGRVGPDQRRQIIPGAEGIRFIALGGVPGKAHKPSAWTELGGPLPTPAA
jgi:mannose-6-phosphate isomerase-like protein (cupin superfamily)